MSKTKTPQKQETLVNKELVIREFEKRYEQERLSLLKFIKKYWELEKKEILDDNWHIDLICDKLEQVYRGKIKRLIINVPPRSLKTELVSKGFPAWVLGQNSSKKFMAISYSTDLAQRNSGGTRDIYQSATYRKIFPRRISIKEDINTKQHWENDAGGQYYATGSSGTITGIGADIIIIDDPLKPEDANSELVRTSINNNYFDTIKTRLNNKNDGAIILIMQRLHDDDLTGRLLELESQGIGEKWEKIIIPAISEIDDEFRKEGDSFFEKRYPVGMLTQLKKENPITFSCQYQQNPHNKDSAEFHSEWYRYYIDKPKYGRIFTVCDPAFKKTEKSDYSAIITGLFKDDELYILEITHGKFDPAELIDKLIYHYKKWKPEKMGIEAFQAQSIIGFNLQNELRRQGLYASIDELKQTGDKETKIRKLIPLYRNGLIFHKRDLLGIDKLENELERFPRGKHDDIIDTLQMLYDMYTLVPNVKHYYNTSVSIQYDSEGRPILINN